MRWVITPARADLTFTTLAGINAAPTASLVVTPQSGDAPLTVELDASASDDSDGTLVGYAWDFGDGTTGSGVIVSHTYATAGDYTVELTVTDDDGAVDTETATVNVLTPGGAGIVSDDFNAAALDGIWMFQNPVGDGSYTLAGAGTQNARLRLSVPAGTNHDVWTAGNRSVRVMQPAADDDFEIEVKFESQPTQRFQSQGLLVEQDPQNFLRLDFYSDGSVLRLFAARFVNGVPTTLRNQTLTAAPTLHLRLTRQGDTWTPKVSYDGVSWIGVSGFSHALAVTSVGVFAGNAGPNPPAYTAVVDYFFNTASPIVPEDALAGPGGNGGPTIDVWYGPYQNFGYLGIPQRWINVLGNVSDPDGIASLTYSLNGGAPRSLAIGPDDRRLADAGDFVVEMDYAELDTLNYVAISATDTLGNTSEEVVSVYFAGQGPWPLPYDIAWDPQMSLQDVIQVVDGDWTVTSEGVRTRTDKIDYDRLLAVGDIDWRNYEITVPVTIHGSELSGPVSGAPGVGIILRWTGHTDSPVVCAQPHCGWLPSGPIGWWRYDKFTLDDQVDPTVTLLQGVPYVWKMRAQTWEDSGQTYHSYSLKAWELGTAEPSQWNLTKTYAGGVVTNGSALLVAHHMDVTFGDLTVIGLDDAVPPLISNVSVEPLETSATITWTTDRIATSRVDYGLTSAHESGAITDDGLTTSHVLTLDNLQPGTLYHYKVSSVSQLSVPAVSGDLVFTTAGAQDNSGLVSDDFSASTLDGIWTFLNPVGDGGYALVGAGTADAHLRLSVPKGIDHDVWPKTDLPVNRSVRVMQVSRDEDLEIEVKFESNPTQRFQSQGLLVEQDPLNFLRLDFYSDGSALRLFAASFVGGVPTTRFNQVITAPTTVPSTLYLRLTRQGDIWTPQYSDDGVSWTVLGSFSHALNVGKAGVFAGNAGANPPAHTAVVDYFFNTATPVDPEDPIP